MALAFLFTVACGKSTGVAAKDAGGPVPAPSSSLARALGADDAGRGTYSYADGPACGRSPRIDYDKPLGLPATKQSAELMADTPGGDIAFFETQAAPPEPSLDPRAPLRLTLTAPRHVKPGQAITLTAALENRSETDVVYPVAVDGSFWHWRWPYVDLYARDESTGKTYRWAYGRNAGRCGNVNSRSAEDFVSLPAGQRRDDPFGGWSHDAMSAAIKKPGRYTLWLVYASDCMGVERGVPLGSDAPTPEGAFEGIVPSNAVVVQVTP